MTFSEIEEYNMISIAILGCNISSKITVALVTLPKAVLGTVKIFAVYPKLGVNPTQDIKMIPYLRPLSLVLAEFFRSNQMCIEDTKTKKSLELLISVENTRDTLFYIYSLPLFRPSTSTLAICYQI